MRGDGEEGRDPATEPFLDTVGELSALRSGKNSPLARGERGSAAYSVALVALIALPAGETAREDP